MHRGNGWARELGLHNVHYLAGNAALLLQGVLRSYPGPLACVSVQYPDPHVHRARHLVQRDFAQMLAGSLPSGGAGRGGVGACVMTRAGRGGGRQP